MVDDLLAERSLVGAMFVNRSIRELGMEFYDKVGRSAFLDERHADICAAAEYIHEDKRRFDIDSVLQHLGERLQTVPVTREFIVEIIPKDEDLWMATIWFYRLMVRAHVNGHLGYQIMQALENVKFVPEVPLPPSNLEDDFDFDASEAQEF